MLRFAPFLVFILFFSSCKKEPEQAVSGRITLSTKLVLSGQYSSKGFSFSEAKFLSFPGAAAARVDLLAFATRNNEGFITGAGLICPSRIDSSFYLAGTAATLTQAEILFSQLRDIPVEGFLDVVTAVNPNEIWIIRTGSDSYAKILVRSVQVFPNGDDPYTDLELDWYYQVDGAGSFSD